MIDAARIVVADPFTNAALENLYEALRAYDAAPEANAAYWRDNECRIKGIL